MWGAIIGDIVGSRFEFDNIRSKDFELFDKKCFYTDDTVITVAVADALLKVGDDRLYSDEIAENKFKKQLVENFHRYGRDNLDCGFGGRFYDWIVYGETQPYNSYGNGSAMRVSPVGWYADTLDNVKHLAKLTAEVTHNHPEGIKGAEAVAVAIFLARKGYEKDEIRQHIIDNYYKIDFTLDELRGDGQANINTGLSKFVLTLEDILAVKPVYGFDETCQGSVPQALEAFFESVSFEDTIRNAISIGGDSDTIAAIACSVAEAYYGIDDGLKERAKKFLNAEYLQIVDEFCKRYQV